MAMIFYFSSQPVAESSAISVTVTQKIVDVTNKIYNNNARLTETGGNDYWESGVINPDVILKDIIVILHPDMFPGYKTFYYRKLN